MINMRKFIYLFLSLLLASCSMTAVNKAEKAKIYADFIKTNHLESLKKISSFRFQSFISLDNEHLIISTSPSKSYLIALKSYCTDLIYAQHFAFKQTFPSILSVKFDAIIVPNYENQICYIESIYKLSKKQVAALAHLVKKSP